MRSHPGYGGYPVGFFRRADESDDASFYEPVRLVHHIDEAAVAGVGELYLEQSIDGRVLDLMGSWVSHFLRAPRHLSVLGMNWTELHANPMADDVVAHDLNHDPRLPWNDRHFDDVVCAVSVDYLTQPLEVFAEVARVLRPGGRFVCTFSNRCFPTKAIAGWLRASDEDRCAIVADYFRLAGGFDEPVTETRIAAGPTDPLFAVWATRQGSPIGEADT